jgi:addiction module RelE/StbE family toxin
MVKVVWTQFALDDLKAIHEYISKDSKVYADRFIEKVIRRVDQLEQFPQSGRVVPEFDSETLKELIEGNYRIVYKTTTDYVAIIRVHHSSQNLS